MKRKRTKKPITYGDYRQKLFNHFAQEYNMHLLESQMEEIEYIVTSHIGLIPIRK